MANQQDPYQLLGVTPKEEIKVIKKAYRKLMMKYHEDRVTSQAIKFDKENGTNEAEQKITEARQMSTEINAAYEILKDEEKRSTYDKYGHSGLEALENGENPTKSSQGRKGHSFKDAADVFGGEQDPLAGISDEELMDMEDTNTTKNRDFKGILKDAAQKPEFQTVDEMMEDLGKKPKPQNKDRKPAGDTLRDVAGKLGGLFSQVKDRAEEFISDQQDNNTTSNGAELAARLQTVAEVLVESDGQIDKLTLKSIINELASIANDVQGETQQQRPKSGFNL